eukprot:TRINITY_DN38298_c0_g1_i1.p1 TRINITY_DN38298_c0_g1~~TRINITY_DN38298_c0_g1_i1.p1  ORF type:complete len:836 (+),score=292.27 TRINITY_DN38298_c0_g1_i1:167-2509(+)
MMDKWKPPHKLGATSKGTMTENETLEEEIAQLNARINLLVRAGADYRKKVDNLFAVTKEESCQEEQKAHARVRQLEDLSRKLTEELRNVNGMLGQERLSSEKLHQEVEQLSRENVDLTRRLDAATAAQRRVEEELESAARSELQNHEHQREVEDRLQELEEANARLTSELKRRTSDLAEATSVVESLKGCDTEVKNAHNEVTRLQIERTSFEQLIKALQNRNQELEREVTELRNEISKYPPIEEYNNAIQAEAALIEKQRNLENSNRVLHREADRKKQMTEAAEQKVEELTRHVEIIEDKLAECLADKQAAREVETTTRGTDAVEEEDWCAKYAELQKEYELLLEHREHERMVEEQVRDLCEELDAEVERLTEENNALRDGLNTIEATFGRLLPQEEEQSTILDSSVISERPQHFSPRRALLNNKEKFTQTVAQPPAKPTPEANAKEVMLLEAEIRQLKAQREAERAAATNSFKAKIKEVLAMFSSGERPEEIHVTVNYPAGRGGVLTPQQAEDRTGTMASVEAIALLRQRTLEAAEWERKCEVSTMLAQQLSDENDDLREHVRRLSSSDPQARTLHAMLASSIRSAEKRINETLSRYKSVLRNRSVLVSLVASCMKSLAQLRDVAGETHLWLRGVMGNHPCLMPDLETRLTQLNDLVEQTRAEHKRVSAECFTQWERTQTGIATDTPKKTPNYRDITQDLRVMEELLNTLWVSFTIQKIPRKPEPRRLFSPVAAARGPHLDYGSTDGVTPPLVQIGHSSALHTPMHKTSPGDGHASPMA